jgi:hypothetical protein
VAEQNCWHLHRNERPFGILSKNSSLISLNGKWNSKKMATGMLLMENTGMI